MSSQRRRLSAVIAGLVMIVCAGCGSSGGGDGAGSTIRMALSVGSIGPQTAMYSSLPDRLGFWAEEGLNVDVVPSQGSGVALSAILGDQADVAVVGGSSVMQAVADGEPFVIPYVVAQRGLVRTGVQPDSRIQSYADLAGATVGVSDLSSAVPGVTKAYAAAAGVDPASMTFIAVGTGPQAAHALISGGVDAVADSDGPLVAYENAGVPLRVLESVS